MASALIDQVADYLEEKRRKKSPATAEQYRAVLENIFLPWAEAQKITEAAQVNDKAMDRFTDWLKTRKHGKKQEPPSTATLRTYVRAVRVFLSWADVPKGRYEPPAKPKRLRDIPSRQEIDAMERAALDERDRLIVRVLADTGIRVSELLGLRLEDLLENTHDRQYFIRVIGKGDKQRDVAIEGKLFRRLKHYAEPQNTDFIFNGKRRRPNGQVEVLTKSGVEQLIRNLAKRAEITKRVYPHLMRHHYITHQIRKGTNLIVLQRQVGHSNLSQISETYAHVVSADGYAQLTGALKA